MRLSELMIELRKKLESEGDFSVGVYYAPTDTTEPLGGVVLETLRKTGDRFMFFYGETAQETLKGRFGEQETWGVKRTYIDGEQ